MRPDAILDAFYLLGSLTGGLSGFQVCPANLPRFPRNTDAVVWSRPWRQPVTAFLNVNVIPMDTERVLANQTVLIEEGRILVLGPASKVPVPAGAVRIDGKGKFLMPGLADMHAHFNLSDIKLSEDQAKDHLFRYLAHGVTTVRHLEGINAQKFARYRSADILGPRLYLGGGPGVVPPTGADDMAAFVAAAKAAGSGYIDVTGYLWEKELPPERREQFDSLLAAARRIGLPVSSHAHSESPEQMKAMGRLGSIEHLSAFRPLLARPAVEVSETDIQAVVGATQRAGIWITVTLVCTAYNQKPTSDLAFAQKFVKALQDAGVGLLLGIDSPGGIGLSPSVVHIELANLVRAGLTPYQALRTGTYNVAQYLQLLDSSGTVAVGKWADLVLLPGNPLDDIRHAREPVGVMIGGRWLARDSLDRGLLANPKTWFRKDVQGSILPRLNREQDKLLKEPWRRVKMLLDSLEAAKSPEPAAVGTSERLLSLVTTELGAIRAVLTPEQRESFFDRTARVWMREQARQGHPMPIAGVVLDTP